MITILYLLIKSEEILSYIEPGIGLDDVQWIAGMPGDARWVVANQLEPGGGVNVVELPDNFKGLDQVEILPPLFEGQQVELPEFSIVVSGR